MKLLTKEIREQLLKNGAANNKHREEDGHCEDFAPVVKLFCPWGGATWLLSEITETEGTNAIMFGLCDLGHGFPELGYVTLDELLMVSGPGGLQIERDRHWHATAPLSAYAERAREAGRIVDYLKAMDAAQAAGKKFAERQAELRQAAQ